MADDPPHLIARLLRRGWLSPAAILSGEVRITDHSRRNANYHVERGAGGGYVVKQPITPGARDSLLREGDLLRHLRRRQPGLRRHLPRCLDQVREEGVVVFERLGAGESLRAYQHRRRGFSSQVAKRMGVILGRVHGAGVSSAELASTRVPWILEVHRPRWAIRSEISAGNLELIRVIQRTPTLGAALDRLRAGWQAERLVHFDVKFDNWVVCPRPGARAWPELALVDWEFAGRGDPLWDVGSTFGAYLAEWLYSVPMVAGEAPSRFLSLARHPIRRMHPALRAFWAAYAREGGVADQDRALSRSVAFAGARLIQTVYERLHEAGALDGHALAGLQLAANLLERPAHAATSLLGIPLRTLGHE